MSTGSGAEDPRARLGSPAYRRAMLALFCAGAAAFGQLYAPQGILPDIAGAFQVSADASSWAVGAATIGVAAGVLPWAILSDRIGRARAMRYAVIAGVLASLLLPLAPSFGLLVTFRLIEGFAFAGVPALAVTMLAESVSPLALGAAVGTYISGNTIGGLVGRIVAAGVGDVYGWRMGLLAVSLLSAMVAIAFVFVVQPTKVQPKRVPFLRGLRVNLRNPGVMLSVVQAFLLMGSFVSAYNYLTFRLQQPPFGLSLTQVSWIFLTYLAGGIASRMVWRLVPRTHSTGAMVVSIGVLLAGLALTLLPSLLAVIVGLALFTGGFFGAHSLASMLGPRRSTEAQSMVPPLYNLGFYSGSSVLGWLGGLAFVAGGWAGTAAMIAVAAVLVAVLTLLYAVQNGGMRAADA